MITRHVTLGAAALLIAATGCEAYPRQASHKTTLPTQALTPPTREAAFAPPPPESIPKGPLGDSIKRGRDYVTQTKEKLPKHTGNGLHCTSCHLDAGRTAFAAPWVGISAVFPEFRARNAKVNLLEDRINDCFERSMNGTALPADSDAMRDIVAYMGFLSQGVAVGQEVPGRGFARITPQPVPDRERGKAIYATRCAACHGDDGAGKTTPDGGYLFPALWGDKSFNLGAGMARLHTAAAFVKTAMPLGAGNTLTAQEAYDVAAYFTTQPRPDFRNKAKDWPDGGKPPDARY